MLCLPCHKSAGTVEDTRESVWIGLTEERAGGRVPNLGTRRFSRFALPHFFYLTMGDSLFIFPARYPSTGYMREPSFERKYDFTPATAEKKESPPPSLRNTAE